MSRLQLSEEELGATVQRAREIAGQADSPSAPLGNVEAFLSAAEEMGIPREACLQALRERGNLSDHSFEVGQRLFAPSVDGNWYPATLVTLAGTLATVRFLGGGESNCAVTDLRPFQLIPGAKMQGDLKDWGWWSIIIDRYDEEKGKVYVKHDDWTGGQESLPVHKIRLAGKKLKAEKEAATFSERYHSALVRCAILAGTTGVVVGMILDRLLQWVLR